MEMVASYPVFRNSRFTRVLFSNLQAGGPAELFAGKENVIAGIFQEAVEGSHEPRK